ncbi:unnamed protein product [Urochloa humidicola]
MRNHSPLTKSMIDALQPSRHNYRKQIMVRKVDRCFSSGGLATFLGGDSADLQQRVCCLPAKGALFRNLCFCEA